jgi:hypothetical protein
MTSYLIMLIRDRSDCYQRQRSVTVISNNIGMIATGDFDQRWWSATVTNDRTGAHNQWSWSLKLWVQARTLLFIGRRCMGPVKDKSSCAWEHWNGLNGLRRSSLQVKYLNGRRCVLGGKYLFRWGEGGGEGSSLLEYSSPPSGNTPVSPPGILQHRGPNTIPVTRGERVSYYRAKLQTHLETCAD